MVMKLPDFLTEWPFGEIVLTRHRIGLYEMMIYHRDGYTAEMLHELFPTLPLDVIEKVLAFARDNQTQVDAYVDRCRAECDRQYAEYIASGRGIDWEELRRRFEAMKNAGEMMKSSPDLG
jgi:uncharacterized protein (DUF433 family)